MSQNLEGQRLTDFLNFLKIKPSQFADSVDTSRGNVSNWINNNKLPNGDQTRQIMIVYPQFNIRWWFTGNGNMILSESEMNQTSKTDLIKYKTSLAEKVVENDDLKKSLTEQVGALEKIADLLEELIPPEQLKEMIKKFGIEKYMKGIRGK